MLFLLARLHSLMVYRGPGALDMHVSSQLLRPCMQFGSGAAPSSLYTCRGQTSTLSRVACCTTVDMHVQRLHSPDLGVVWLYCPAQMGTRCGIPCHVTPAPPCAALDTSWPHCPPSRTPHAQPDFRLVVDRPLSERPRHNKWILGAWVVLVGLGILNMVHKASAVDYEVLPLLLRSCVCCCSWWKQSLQPLQPALGSSCSDCAWCSTGSGQRKADA